MTNFIKFNGTTYSFNFVSIEELKSYSRENLLEYVIQQEAWDGGYDDGNEELLEKLFLDAKNKWNNERPTH